MVNNTTSDETKKMITPVKASMISNDSKQQKQNKWWSTRFENKLNNLIETSSKESYQTLAKWFLFNRKYINDFVYILREYINNNTSKQSLYMNLINEILCNDKNTSIHKWERYTAIRVTIGENVLLQCIDSIHITTLQKILLDYIKIWDDFNVFDGPTILNQLKRKINISIQERSNTNTNSAKKEKQQQPPQSPLVVPDTIDPPPFTLIVSDVTKSPMVNIVLAEDNEESKIDVVTKNDKELPSSAVEVDKELSSTSDIVVTKKEDIENDQEELIVVNNTDIDTTTVIEKESTATALTTPNKKDTNDENNTKKNVSAVNDDDDDGIIRSHSKKAVTAPIVELDINNIDNEEDDIIAVSNHESDSPTKDNDNNIIMIHDNNDEDDDEVDDVDALLAGTNRTSPTNNRSTSGGLGVDDVPLMLLSSSSTTKDGNIEYDFENMGIPYQKVDPKEFIEHCKTIATLQIARDLRNDGAVQLSSLLSSLPDDIQKLCNSDTNTTVILDDMKSRDYVHRMNQPDIILHMDLNEQLLNIQNFREIIFRQQISRAKIMKYIIAARCNFGSNDSAIAYTNTTESLTSLLHHRSQLLSDAMELEGFDMAEADDNGTKEPPHKKIKTELSPLTWYQPPKDSNEGLEE